MMMCIYDSVYMPICVLCIVTNNQVVRLQFMAKISGLDVHLIEKSGKYQWFTWLVLGMERLFRHNLHP